MIFKLLTTSVALMLATVVHGTTHDDLLAAGYEYFADVGYYYFGTGKTWISAQQDCLTTGSRLALINDEKERSVLVPFLRNKTYQDYVFAGFTNRLESRFVTTEGIPLERALFPYPEWDLGQPSGTADRCGGINITSGLLTELSCGDYNKPYVCEHQLWTDYTLVEGVGYYKLHTEGKPWADAYEICEHEGGHLLVVDSQAEADAVMGIFNKYPDFPNASEPEFVSIGFRAIMSDLSTDPDNGVYLTIFGTSVSKLGYVKWHGTEPQPQSLYFCGALARESAGYYMKECNLLLAFFCEKELEDFSRT